MDNAGPWNYILVWSDTVGTRDAVKEFINSRDEIITWNLCMSNAIFIRSMLTADGIQKMFREFTVDKGRFIVLDCATDRNGWLPQKTWDFLQDK